MLKRFVVTITAVSHNGHRRTAALHRVLTTDAASASTIAIAREARSLEKYDLKPLVDVGVMVYELEWSPNLHAFMPHLVKAVNNA